MDAISFVLGIKSSHLRSAHLRDLVYRGRVLKTSKINDDGSADAPATNGHENDEGEDGTQSQRSDRNDPKSAWVMAVYEDDAGDEQRWKRTITNQGVSEYRINNKIVTAQQYNDALEAENILIKARNFLVFQGDVEAIASQSPKDLTRLIEQISGSLDHKVEYERLEAEAEAAAEHQNYTLNRRRGINSEIKQWKEQQEEVKSYEAKIQQRDDAIVTHILWKLYHFQRVMEESGAEIQRHQNELKEFRRGVVKYEEALEAARRDRSETEKEVHQIERNIKKKDSEIQQKMNDLVPIDEKISQSKSDAERIQQRLDKLIKERDDQAASIAKVKKDLSTVEKAQSHFEAQWKETVKNQGRELSEADLKEYNKLRAQVVNQTSGNQAKLENMLRQLKIDEVTLNSLKSKVEASQSLVDKRTEDVESLSQRKDATRETVKALSQELEAKKKEVSKLTSERTRTNQKRTETEEKLQEVLRKLSEANDGKRQNEKELRTKEMVKELKRLYPGVKGRIGELCKPKQKKFDEAVITALGRDFDSVVVDTEKTGTECVQYLKESRFGPMTFIPLDNIKVNAVNSSMKSIPKARLTIDTIDFDPSLERAMSYACGSSIVCDDLATAKHICYDKGIQVKAVTLEGFVIHKAGLMTGGRGAEGKGGKRRFEEHDIQNLDKMRESLMSTLASLPKMDRRSSAEEQLQHDLTGLEERLRSATSELGAFEHNLTDAKKALEHEKRQLKEIKPKFNEKTKELESIQKSVKAIQDDVSKVEDKVFQSFCQRLGYDDIRAYEAQQGSLEQEASQKRGEFEYQKQRYTSALSWEQSRFKDTESRVSRMQQTVEVKQADIIGYEKQKAKLEGMLDHINAELEILNSNLDKKNAVLSTKSDKVTAAKSEVTKRSKNVDAATKTITSLETEVQRESAHRYALLRRCKLEQIKIPLQKNSKSLDSLPVESALQTDPDAMDVDDEDEPELMGTDYGIEVDFKNLDDDLAQSAEDDIHEKLMDNITALNAELEKLNPNMRASERFEATEARLKATDMEFEEARKAAKESRDAFVDVKEKRFELFNKAFTHISEQITHVYKDLTRSANFPLGGQAYLDIEDTDTPYLSGIKYHAMPPLKRFRDMEHLSGGEKTMAALALLFAVHSYQPSPFFVLDEVDAALDNANVEKIRNYIRDHAGPGMQFIVISLKTGLFQGSESLVGVYRDQDANSSNTLTLDVSYLSKTPIQMHTDKA